MLRANKGSDSLSYGFSIILRGLFSFLLGFKTVVLCWLVCLSVCVCQVCLCMSLCC